jgi:hypothetical protein
MSKVNTTPETTTSTAKRGRPTVEGSKRQAVLAMRAAKVAAGGEIKRGRPAGTKKLTVDPTVEVVLNVKAPKASKAQKQAEMAARKAASNEEREVVASEIELVEAGLM